MAERGEVFIFPDRERAADFMAEQWERTMLSAVESTGVFSVALSGGRSPAVVYERLSRSGRALPWDRTHVFLVDERFVPAGDTKSNFRLIHEHLLARVPISTERVHTVVTDTISLEDAARGYEQDLKEFFTGTGDVPEFDLVMLGMGEDGHTASLFPGMSGLQEETRLAVPVITGRVDTWRISLSLRVINNAHTIIFFVTGRNKAQAVQGVIRDRNRELPAALVTPSCGVLMYVLDSEAAALLEQRPHGNG